MDTRTTGFPSPAADYTEGRISIDHLANISRASVFIFTVEGNSMEGAHIPDKAKLVVDRSKKPKHGDIVVAVVNQETIVRRLQIKGTSRQLVPDHPKFKPYQIEGELMVFGVVTHVFLEV